jgi:hypothetical protein
MSALRVKVISDELIGKEAMSFSYHCAWELANDVHLVKEHTLLNKKATYLIKGIRGFVLSCTF